MIPASRQISERACRGLLHERLWGAWLELGLKREDAFHELVSDYCAPERAYHNLDHILACLEVAEGLNHGDPRITIALALLDAVYDPTAKDNEHQSAKRAALAMRTAGAKETDCAAVERLIMATAHTAPPVQEDEKIVVDADLSILGADWETYSRYAAAIRQEYDWVPDDQFTAGRSALLKNMLARETLYWTAPCREKFEAQARENLRRELAQLEALG